MFAADKLYIYNAQTDSLSSIRNSREQRSIRSP